MRVALYARVSTRDKEQNPETQLYALRQYAERREWEVVKIYIDQASAGDLGRRSEWRQLLADVKKRDFDAVLVLKLDRAFRSVLDTANTMDNFQHHKVGFVSITQEFDTTSSTGRLMLNLLAAFAEFERDMISERVKEGMNRAKAEGKHVGRPRKGAQNEH
jgi:DNA invertase Pin-like site-specific DNA recombinase